MFFFPRPPLSLIDLRDTTRTSPPSLCLSLLSGLFAGVVTVLNAPSNGGTTTMMRHGKRVAKLGRPADQRKALVRTLTTEVLRHGKITTTATRAKAIRKYVDKMIQLAKRQTQHSKQQMEAFVYDKALVEAVFEEAPKRYGDRDGGYCRVVKDVRKRRGDAAEMAVIELV